MKKILTFSAAIFFSLNVFSQTPDWQWAMRIGGMGYEVGISITMDDSGNVYSTGLFTGVTDFDPGSGVFNLTSIGDYDIYISKIDNSGNFIWATAMGDTLYDGGSSLALDHSGNLYTTGVFQGTVDFDPGAGVFNLTSAGLYDIFISKLDHSGNFVWAKAIGGTAYDGCASIMLDAFDNVYLTGYFGGVVDFDPDAGIFMLTAAGGYDVCVVKLNNSGNFIWAKTMGGSNNDFAQSVSIDYASGDIYVTGNFRDTADFDPGSGIFSLASEGNQDIFVSKLDASGNFIWAKTMGGLDADYGYSISSEISGGGNVYIGGYFSGTVDFDPGIGTFNLTSNGLDDIFVSNLDGLGNFVWTKSIGGTGYDQCYSLAMDSSGNIYTTGVFFDTVDFDPGTGIFNLSSNGFDDIFISKLDNSGNFVWTKAAGGSGGDRGYSLVLNPQGGEDLYMTGAFWGPSVTFGSATLTNVNTSGFFWEIFITKLDTAIVTGNNIWNEIFETIFFPNPFHEIATLTINTKSFEEGMLEIKNVLGENVIQPKHFTGSQITIQRNNLPSGIYFYRITTKENEILNGKFIIN